MIGKGKSIAHGGNGIDYALKKEHAKIIDKHLLIGQNGKEIKSEFKVFQNLNHRCTNNDISFVISPEPKDGRKLNDNDLKAISKDFLKKMNLDKHQAITIKHSDTEHAHLHIFVNRIDQNGNAYKDKHIGYKSQAIADKIAIERNLTRAKVVEQFNKESLKEVKKEILRLSEVAMQHKPTNLKDYILLMKANKVKVKPTINKAGKMQGLRVEFQGYDFKASEIHRTKLSLKTLHKEIAKSHEIKRERTRYKGYTR